MDIAVAGASLPLSLSSLQLILEIVDRIPWALALLALVPGFCIHKLRLERFPVAICRLLFDDNLLVVVGEFIDDVLDSAFAEFELVKGRDALGSDGDTLEVFVNRGSMCIEDLDWEMW